MRSQRARQVRQIPKLLGSFTIDDRPAGGDRDHIAAELLGVRRGHAADPSSEDLVPMG
jgi:hypothetical protein